MHITKHLTRVSAQWLILGLLLMAGGFACDESTETGHHALLILGGMAVGVGASKERK